MRKRQPRQKKQLLEQLERVPVIEVACKKVGIARSTYYRWIAEDSEFESSAEKALDAGRCVINDVAESKIIQKVSDGDWRAVKYWLESNNKRYARPRRAAEAPTFEVDKPQQVIVKFVGSPSEEDLRRLAKGDGSHAKITRY